MTLIMTITTTVSCAKRMSLSKFSFILSFQLLMLVLGYDTNRLMFSSAMNMVGASSSINSNQHVPVTTCAIVGVGVLGTSLCNQLLRDPDLKDWKCKNRTEKNRTEGEREITNTSKELNRTEQKWHTGS